MSEQSNEEIRVKKNPPWRVQWYNRIGLIRQEWYSTLKEARTRMEALHSGGFEATIYDDSP